MKCPGQDRRFWRPEDITELACDQCGQVVEFFKDEGTRRCPTCGRRIVNPKVSLGCAEWCAHAKECLGYDPKAVDRADSGEASLADRLIEAMKQEFGADQKRIAHALTVLDYAERLVQAEGANPRVVVAAAVLHDIGIQEAERKHGSAAGKYQELEGPPIAERLLRELKFDQVTVSEVSQIIAHHHQGGLDSPEFRVIWDADNLVNSLAECTAETRDEVHRRLTGILKTDGGRQLAERLFTTARTPA